jgi:hypothetical protein
VSYDIAVWEGDPPVSDRAALRVFSFLSSRYESASDPPTARLAAFVRALTARYPDIGDLPDDREGESPWSDGPLLQNAIGPFLYFSLVAGMAEAVLQFIVDSAHEHELVCFDPQTERLL